MNTPAGWYPDEQPGWDRWWNGERWTNHTQRRQVAMPVKRWWFHDLPIWLQLVLVVATAVVVLWAVLEWLVANEIYL